MKAVFIFLMLLSQLGFAAKEEKFATRELLVKGLTVPEKRDFPLSTKVNPCEDFHKYVCSEVEDSFKLPADRSTWTFSFTDSDERILQAQQNYFRLLEKGYVPKTERAHQLKNVYLACMKPDANKKQEKEYVRKEMGLVGALKTPESIMDFLASRLGKPDFTMVDFGSIANHDDPTNADLYLLVNLMSLPEKTYYQKEDVVNALKGVAEEFFKALGMDKPGQRAQSVMDFEKAFSVPALLPAEFRQRLTAKTYLPKGEWLKKYPNFKLEKFLAGIPETTQIRNFANETFEFTNKALAETDPDTLRNVILWHSLKDMMDVGYPKFFAKYFEFRHKYMGGPEKRPPLQERCTKLVKGNFGMELDNELLPILFPNFPEDKVVATAEKVRQSIISGVKANQWLSEEARIEAIKKVQVAMLKLVRPKEEKDWDFLPIQAYGARTPVDNILKIHQAQIDKSLKELKEKRNRARWGMSPLKVNAYYSPSDNQFVLMQGILQYPFFDGAQSDIENIGAIGTVVGHELGHGVDDQGSKYDSTGKLRQWMTMKDLSEFSKRGQQFAVQYDKMGHNGKLTLGENIGDHVGMTFSLHAAFADLEKATVDDLKKFYVAYGRMWCSVMRPEFAALRLKTDPHALGWARINGQVPHQETFAKAFSCKAGDKMFLDPKERTRVW